MGNQARTQHLDVDLAVLMAIAERAQSALSPEDGATLKAAMQTLGFLEQELKSKRASIERLRQIIFGVKTEKTDKVLGDQKDEGTAWPPVDRHCPERLGQSL